MSTERKNTAFQRLFKRPLLFSFRCGIVSIFAVFFVAMLIAAATFEIEPSAGTGGVLFFPFRLGETLHRRPFEISDTCFFFRAVLTVSERPRTRPFSRGTFFFWSSSQLQVQTSWRRHSVRSDSVIGATSASIVFPRYSEAPICNRFI